MKTVEEIYQGMKAAFAARSGYAVGDGCDMAVRLYAAAAEIQSLYCQTEWALKQCFPQSAAGAYLDAHGALRNLTRNGATAAAGEITFSVSEASERAIPIQKGTVCMTAKQVGFATAADAVLPAGETTVTVVARAEETGSAGNVPAQAVAYMSVPPAGIESCGNENAFSGGTDAENDDSFRLRVLESYDRLPNGANAAYYELQAENHAGVTAAKAVGRARGVGTVDVYIATENGLPSAALLQEVLDDLSAKREIAVDLRVLAPAAVRVDVTAVIAVAEGCAFEEVSARANAAVAAFFAGDLLGKAVTRAALGDLLYHIPGVQNYQLTSPAADLAAGAASLPVLGTVTLTESEA